MCRKNLFVLFFIFFISSVVLAASVRNVKIEQTEVKNEVLYIAGENEPFTGIVQKFYENGKLKEEIPYTNGVINGHHIQYSENGKVLKKTFYDNGMEYKGVPAETIALIIAVIVIVILIAVKIMRTLPSFKMLDDYQKERILKRFIEYDNGDENLYSSYRLNGCGTGFYTVRTFTVYNEKIRVCAKMISVFFIPIPFALGYLVCYDNKKIICSVSKEHFKILKKEIEEEL